MSLSVGEADSKTAVFAWIEHEQAPSVKAAVESARPDRVIRKSDPRRPNAGDHFFACGSATERGADERDGRRDVSLDELRIEPKHAVARARKHRVTARVSASLLGVIPAIGEFQRSCRMS